MLLRVLGRDLVKAQQPIKHLRQSVPTVGEEGSRLGQLGCT